LTPAFPVALLLIVGAAYSEWRFFTWQCPRCGEPFGIGGDFCRTCSLAKWSNDEASSAEGSGKTDQPDLPPMETAGSHAESAVRHQFCSRKRQKCRILTSTDQAVPWCSKAFGENTKGSGK
jgi:hypothetical protein